MKYRIIVRDRVREDIRRNRDWWAERHSEAQAERWLILHLRRSKVWRRFHKVTRCRTRMSIMPSAHDESPSQSLACRSRHGTSNQQIPVSLSVHDST